MTLPQSGVSSKQMFANRCNNFASNYIMEQKCNSVLSWKIIASIQKCIEAKILINGLVCVKISECTKNPHKILCNCNRNFYFVLSLHAFLNLLV